MPPWRPSTSRAVSYTHLNGSAGNGVDLGGLGLDDPGRQGLESQAAHTGGLLLLHDVDGSDLACLLYTSNWPAIAGGFYITGSVIFPIA